MTLNEIDTLIDKKQNEIDNLRFFDIKYADREAETYRSGIYEDWVKAKDTRFNNKIRIRVLQSEIDTLIAKRKSLRIESSNSEDKRLLKALKVILKNNMGKEAYERLMRMAQEMADDSAL